MIIYGNMLCIVMLYPNGASSNHLGGLASVRQNHFLGLCDAAIWTLDFDIALLTCSTNPTSANFESQETSEQDQTGTGVPSWSACPSRLAHPHHTWLNSYDLAWLSRLLQYLSLPGNCLAQEGFCASMQQHWFISCNMLTNMLERNMHGTPDQTPLLGVSDGLDGLLNFLLLARMVGKWERTSAENDSYTKMLEAFLFSKEEHDSNFNSTFQVDLLWERRERLLPPLWVDFRKHQQSTNEKGHGNMWRFARVLLLADFPRPLAFQLLPDSAEKWNRAFRCIAWSSALWVFELWFIVIASVHILFKHQSSAMGGID